ncbi:vitamin D3 receptor B [Elysia marginata]|uniref:Vitamin D3 receptor B n=1 Tax=Elysia marginata TaxID=1093978 RepID=A0AAV4H6X4_9GAST|nr:vitamin D3 receptor B [Elysia marginata]
MYRALWIVPQPSGDPIVSNIILKGDNSASKPAAGKREQKRRPKPRDGTVLFCGVCGDRALGYNFDAISCESCKAFFRRNALKTKPFTCSFDGNCKLDAHTRKFCSGCRMKKCFAVGMKKEWILSEDQLSKRRKRQQSRQSVSEEVSEIQPCTSTSAEPSSSYYAQRVSSPHSVGDSQSPPFKSHYQVHNNHFQYNGGYSREDSCDSSMQATSSFRSSHYELCPTLSQQQHKHPHDPYRPAHVYERKWSQCSQDSMDSSPQHSPPYPTSSTSMSGYTSRSPYPSPDGSSGLTAMGAPAQKCLKLESYSHDSTYYLEPVPPSQVNSVHETINTSPEHFALPLEVKSEPLTGNEEYSVPLSPYIKDMLSQLQTVYSDIFEAPYAPEQVPKFTDTPKSADDVFNMTDIFIRRLIKFAKNLPEFKNLDQSDQICLLKGGIMEMFLLRSAMGFDSKSRGWKFKVQNEQCDTGKPKEGKLDSKVLNTLGSSMVMSHITFVQQLQEVTRNDRLVLILLFVIELMSPDRPSLDNHVSVAKCQERHLVWLKAYLDSTMTVVEARSVFSQLLEKLHDVRLLSDESGHLTSSLEISKLAPLLVEVLDLKK